MSTRTFALSILCFSFLCAEPAVYGFGEEEEDYETPKRRQVTLFSLQQKINEQQERIDGLTSMVEGLSASISEMQNNKNSNNGDDLIKNLIAKVDEINANYVSKAELNGVKNGNTKPQNVAVSTKSTAPLSLSSRYTQAVRDYGKRRYANAKEGFELTDSKAYKSAPSNYYLGEIAYYTQNYNDAIFYYKKSAGLNDKASYMDVLFLHIALSLEKTGKKAQAKAFYAMILQNHKGTKSAEIAKKNMERL